MRSYQQLNDSLKIIKNMRKKIKIRNLVYWRCILGILLKVKLNNLLCLLWKNNWLFISPMSRPTCFLLWKVERLLSSLMISSSSWSLRNLNSWAWRSWRIWSRRIRLEKLLTRSGQSRRGCGAKENTRRPWLSAMRVDSRRRRDRKSVV